MQTPKRQMTPPRGSSSESEQDSNKRCRLEDSKSQPDQLQREDEEGEEQELLQKHSLYTEWAQTRSIEISSVAPLALEGRGIGLLATSKLKAESKLIHVPVKAMIKCEPKVLKKYKLQKTSPQSQLAAYLTVVATGGGGGDNESRQPQSIDNDGDHDGDRKGVVPEWYTRSRAVWPTPDDFKACMLAWSSDSELDVIKTNAPSSVLSPLERLLLDLKKDRQTVMHLRPSVTAAAAAATDQKDKNGVEGASRDDMWWDEYVYHWFLVNTRSFHWKPEGVREGCMVMCPVLDYMNHCPNGHGCTVTVSTQGYELRADRDYDPGDEILATYGAHSNDKLLVHYGFVLSDSSDDEIRLDHVILPRLSESQQSTLQDVGFLGGYALDPSTNELCFKTQVAVRSVLLTANEWEHYMNSGEDLTSDKEPEVIEWLMPALEAYKQQAEAAVERLAALRSGDGATSDLSEAFEKKLDLLQERWEQIHGALEHFINREATA